MATRFGIAATSLYRGVVCSGGGVRAPRCAERVWSAACVTPGVMGVTGLAGIAGRRLRGEVVGTTRSAGDVAKVSAVCLRALWTGGEAGAASVVRTQCQATRCDRHRLIPMNRREMKPMWTAGGRGASSSSSSAASSSSSSSSSSVANAASLMGSEAIHAPAGIRSTVASGIGLKAMNGASNLLVSGDAAATRQVAWWLGGCTGLVFSMVVIGGVTRLTRSGLSMTEWRFLGTLPPLNALEWEVEFGKYKRSPEFRKCNASMTLEEFKFIYWMEYAHRMWGRGLGIAFGLPLLYFSFKGYITRRLAIPLSLLFVAGGCQGFIGWWMVKSGLNEPLYHYEIPRVSPYRLATHLTSAFAIYTGLLWTTLSVALPESPASLATSAAVRAGAVRLRTLVVPLTGLIGVTAISGAFVAGLDAGHAYNTFPLMDGRIVPEEIFRLQPMWKNFFENTATVQFDHRLLAASTLSSVSAVWLLTRGMPMPARSALLLNALLGVTCMQVSLGIATLLNYVPVSLGSAHQAGALTLFSVAISLLHSLRK